MEPGNVERYLAFTAEQAASLAGLSPRQLAYWDRTEFFSPSFGGKQAPGALRLYSFRDIIGLRTIARLLEKVPLTKLREVQPWLARYGDTPWTRLRFLVEGREVLFLEPETDIPVSLHPAGQSAHREALSLGDIVEETLADIREIRERRVHGKTSKRRGIMGGNQVVAGTRIPTSTIWELAGVGYDVDRIIDQFPVLTVDDVDAALKYERTRRAG